MTKVLPKVSIAEQYKYATNIMKSGDFEKAEIAFFIFSIDSEGFTAQNISVI